ncbi:MAG: YCF48-related protein [Flavobacteriales bacterium]
MQPLLSKRLLSVMPVIRGFLTTLLLLGIPFVGQSQCGPDWEWKNRYPQSNTLSDIEVLTPEKALSSGGGAVLLSTEDTGSNWQVKECGYPLGQIYKFKKLDFLTPSEGWGVAGFDGIYHSEDSGETWTDRSSGLTFFAKDVQFVTEQKGYVVGQAQGGGNLVLTTTDEGNSWSKDSLPGSGSLSVVSAPDSTHAWALNTMGTIWHSSDGGTTWDSTMIGSYPNLDDLYFIDSTEGWAVGYETVYHTTDGGTTWTEETPDPTLHYRSVQFVTPSKGWILGRSGTIFRTTDGGNSWDQITLNGSTYYKTLEFGPNGTVGYVVGNKGAIQRSTDGGIQWTRLSEGRTNDLTDQSFPNDSSGWVVGDKGAVLHTGDGGADWSSSDISTNTDMNGVSFVDTTHGWAVGQDGKIFATNDGGAIWSLQNSGTNKELFAVQFLDEDTGYVVGEDKLVLKTTNGGSDWNIVMNGSTGNDADLKALHFFDEEKGWVAGGNYAVHRTKDGGNTWLHSLTGTAITAEFNSVHFIDDSVGIAAGEYCNSGRVKRSTDGGDTWQIVHTGYNAFRSLSFVNDSVGYLTAQGALLRTEDSGQTWTKMPVWAEQALTSVHFRAAEQALVTGWNGTLYRLAGSSDEPTSIQGRPGTNASFRIFPNPTQDRLKIRYRSSSTQEVELLLRDKLGRVVLARDNPFSQEGRASLMLSSLPSGIYFLEIRGDQERHVKRLVKE